MQLTPGSIQTILSRFNIEALNDMQVAALATAEQHQDWILHADTGSGKTLGFLLPVLSWLDPSIPGTQALIIAPSRELAQQIEQVFKTMSTGFKVTCCYGGHLRETEENNLLEAPALIIGTPGRLADHIRRGNIRTSAIQALVLDEFDKSLEAGFHEEMAFIINSLTSLQRRILTSATKAIELPDFVGLKEPQTLDYVTGEKPESLSLQLLHSPDKDKVETLFRLICRIGNRSVIVFCNHRESVERTSTLLRDRGIHNVFYHGALEQPERDSALAKFRNGSSKVLVTTDLASRGLDVPNIRYIVHYHLPPTEDVMTHRNGRTARMDASGTIVFLLGPDESLPSFVPTPLEDSTLPETPTLPSKPEWTTLFISAGKKDKVNKVDIVGFFTHKGHLKKEDLGLIEVKDFFSFIAVRKSRVSDMLHQVKDEKMKNKKVKIHVAK